jgi:hypothetical protein
MKIIDAHMHYSKMDTLFQASKLNGVVYTKDCDSDSERLGCHSTFEAVPHAPVAHPGLGQAPGILPPFCYLL